MVLDPWGPARYRRRPERLAALRAQADTDPVTALKALTELAPQVVDLGLFGVARNLKKEALDDVVAHAGVVALPAPGVEGGPFGFAAARFTELETATLAALKAHHESNPNSAGLEPQRLRLALPTRVAPAPFSSVTTALLKARKIEADGPWLRLPGHSVRLSPQDERIWAKIQPVLQSVRFGPPRVRDFAEELDVAEPQVRDLMRRLSRMAVVWQVAPDHFFLRDAVAEMARIVEDLATNAPDGTFKAAEFRDRIGGGRKVAIQILEFFDRAGLTSLKNERRTIDRVKLERFVGRVGAA
jgi:selenocysteine-specific elongation factor